MAFRIASIMGLMSFAVCLIVGAFQADNPFTTTVSRALVALLGTMCVGLLVGVMAQKMLDENLKTAEAKISVAEGKPSVAEEKIKNNSAAPPGDGR
jgi:hypothetical protein